MIETARLRLRPIADADTPALRGLWADPIVTADLGGIRTAAEADAIVARHRGFQQTHGLGFLVVERRNDGRFVGFCGLKPGAEQTPIAGELEIGWALVRDAWGCGFATEAATAARDWGFEARAEPRIVAITARRNAASRRVMDRIGMRRIGDFRHHAYAPDDAAGDAVVYAVDRPGRLPA